MSKWNQISCADREQILKLSALGYSQRYIAKSIGKNQSNISRELRRKDMNCNTYSIAEAQVDRNIKASNKGANSKLDNSVFLKFVKEKITELRWSPEQVSGYLKKDGRSRQISYETIYRYIYSLQDLEEKTLWIKSLRQRQKKRRSRKGKTEKRGKIPNRVSIHDRPQSVEGREEFGHWEGDLMIGKNHASAIGTVVERVTRYTLIVELPNQRISETVVGKFSAELNKLPIHCRRSMTYDNGHEMSKHEQFSEKTGMSVYFADPGCPSQRGTNENTNGLIRDFFPKGTDFSSVSYQELKRTETLLNQRPRKVLGFKTPEQALRKMMKRAV